MRSSLVSTCHYAICSIAQNAPYVFGILAGLSPAFRFNIFIKTATAFFVSAWTFMWRKCPFPIKCLHFFLERVTKKTDANNNQMTFQRDLFSINSGRKCGERIFIAIFIWFFFYIASVIRNVLEMQKHLFSFCLSVHQSAIPSLMMAFCVCIFLIFFFLQIRLFFSLSHISRKYKKKSKKIRDMYRVNGFIFLFRLLLFGVHFRLFFTVRRIFCSKQLHFSIRLIKI